jgi:hypothetical protein
LQLFCFLLVVVVVAAAVVAVAAVVMMSQFRMLIQLLVALYLQMQLSLLEKAYP